MFLKSFFLGLSISVFLPWASLNAQEVEQSNNSYICKSNLNLNIEKVINKENWEQSRWGIFIQDSVSGEVFFALNSDKFFLPASNVKLLITAAALLKLGADYSISTPVYLQGNAPNLSALIIKGKGDPSLTSQDLQKLVTQLKNQGITEINNLIIDDSYFSEFGINPSWEWSDLLTYYAPNVNSLMLNENAVILTIVPEKVGDRPQLQWSDKIAAQQWEIDNQAITTAEKSPSNLTLNEVLGRPTLAIRGSIPLDSESSIWGLSILDPSTYFAESLEELLLTAEIKIDNIKIIRNAAHQEYNKKNSIILQSKKLSELVTEINQNSNNLFAEALWKILQIEFENEDIVKEVLAPLGVNPNSFILADGSGLSRQNLVTPEALVNTLKLMSSTSQAEIYRQSLTVAGVNGTLENRFQNTEVMGKMRGKTGSLTGVSALSGYLPRENSTPLIFSIIVNNSQQPGRLQRQAIDEIVILLQKLRDDC